jgi:hypothetical protein
MSEVMDPQTATLLDLAAVADAVTALNRRVLDLQLVITDEKRKRRDLMAALAVDRVQFSQLAARVAMVERSWCPPWADAEDLTVVPD